MPDPSRFSIGAGDRDAGADLLLKIHEFGLELASLPAGADLHAHIARKLTTLTGAGLVTIGSYDPVRHGLVLHEVVTDSVALQTLERAIGMRARDLLSPLSAENYARIVRERVGVYPSLTDVSFGAIPPAVSAVVQGLTGFERFIGIGFVHDNALFGTAVLGFRIDVPHPPLLLLDAFASIAAISLKRHAVEADLRHTTEQLQGIAANLPGVVFEFIAKDDGRMGFTYISDSIERMLGEPAMPLDTLYERLMSRVVDEDRQGLADSIRQAAVHRRAWRYDARVILPDGRLAWFRGLSTPRPGHGSIAFDGIFLDITDQRRAEDSAREQRGMVEAMVSASPDWVWAMDAQGRHTYSNPAVHRMLGVPPESVIGTTLGLAHPDDAPFLSDTFERAVAERRGWQNILARWRTTTGEYRYLESSAVPIISETGVLQGFRGIDRDVTERVQAESARARLEEQLQQAQKMESVGRLAGGVAHDFNNLLTVINGYAELLLAEVNPADPVAEGLEQIRKAGTRAAALTQRLLAFSRKQVMQPRVLILDRVLGDLQPMLARLVGEDVEMKLQLSAPHASVHADPHQIEQVVLNLVVNARDAMPRGGRLVIETAEDSNVRLETTDPMFTTQCVRLTVADTGTGMDEATRQQMFEPFFTTKGVGKGTGLGLAMVHGIVAQSGGTIDVDTEPGVGTAIHIYLPRVAPERAVESSPPQGRAALGGKEVVLVVEDQEEVRNYAATALRAYGYSVLTAANAGEALLIDERESKPIDLLLTDVVMPHLSGRELAERLAARSPTLRVLYMSGYTDDVVVHHGVKEERAGFLQKPFTPQQLAGAVHAALIRRGHDA